MIEIVLIEHLLKILLTVYFYHEELGDFVAMSQEFSLAGTLSLSIKLVLYISTTSPPPTYLLLLHTFHLSGNLLHTNLL